MKNQLFTEFPSSKRGGRGKQSENLYFVCFLNSDWIVIQNGKVWAQNCKRQEWCWCVQHLCRDFIILHRGEHSLWPISGLQWFHIISLQKLTNFAWSLTWGASKSTCYQKLAAVEKKQKKKSEETWAIACSEKNKKNIWLISHKQKKKC